MKELAVNQGGIVSHDDIYTAVWRDETAYYNEQSPNNCIRRLRTILERDTAVEISVQRGLGNHLKVNGQERTQSELGRIYQCH